MQLNYVCCVYLRPLNLSPTHTPPRSVAKTDGQPEEPEKLGLELSSLVGGDAAGGAETSNPAGEEGRGDIFRGDSLEGPCLGPSSVPINGSEAVEIGSSRGKRSYDVELLLFTRLYSHLCPWRAAVNVGGEAG